MADQDKSTEIKALGTVLLDIAALLMVSGASTGRVRNTITRISNSFGYSTDMLISQRTLMLNVYDAESDQVFTSLKRTLAHGVNFRILSDISHLSWQISEQNWTVAEISEEIKRIRKLPSYHPLLVLMLVGLSGAAFCRLAGGGIVDMAAVFAGSFCGLYIRQQATKIRFNPYLCLYFAALTSSLIAGLPLKITGIPVHEHAVATSVLFLIPGVPLINSFSDMIDGNLQNGLIRGLNGFIISFSLALGLLTSIYIYHL
jgi:uncharacterized membrane protein YjjP (DUF1212 family)